MTYVNKKATKNHVSGNKYLRAEGLHFWKFCCPQKCGATDAMLLNKSCIICVSATFVAR